MATIKETISAINDKGEKALSVFLTAGFPEKGNFVDMALQILDAGADMLEIGIPFSDPLADGPVIQQSSQIALQNGITMRDVFQFTTAIRRKSNKPLVLMGYANPAYRYGLKNFFREAKDAGANGLIIPDIPMEEYDKFFEYAGEGLDVILLATPASGAERTKAIDEKSKGFVYCVSVLGTTGARKEFSPETIAALAGIRSAVQKNKMLVGFGISGPANVKQIAPHCDGVIVGSAIVRSLSENGAAKTLELVAALKEACKG